MRLTRACLYTELMERCDGELAQEHVNEELGGLLVYAKEQLQTPFGYPTVHFIRY
jgi:hypothetical protein